LTLLGPCLAAHLHIAVRSCPRSGRPSATRTCQNWTCAKSIGLLRAQLCRHVCVTAHALENRHRPKERRCRMQVERPFPLLTIVRNGLPTTIPPVNDVK
jgi:hypothetical protein